MTRTNQEERAFESLLVSSARRVDTDDVDIDAIPEPNEKEQQVLQLLGTDFIEEIIDGTRAATGGPADDEFDRLAVTGAVDGAALLRAEQVDEETAAELEARDSEVIDRKKREQEDQTNRT